MMKLSNIRLKDFLKIIAPSFTVGIIMLAVLFINKIYPFGAKTIDYYDMAQQTEAFIYHIYDVLHGKAPIFYDWYTGLGRIIPGGTNISPISLIYYLVGRTSIRQAMSYITIIKQMLMALSAYVFLNKAKPTKYFYEFVMAAGYGLSGYVLMNYTIPHWLDLAIWVPLVLLFSRRALLKGSCKGLIVSIAVMLINSYYVSFLMLLMLFMVSAIYVLYYFLNKKNLHILQFGIAIISGMCISMFSWWPDVYNTFASARISNSTGSGILGGYKEILEQIYPAYMSRWWVILGLSFMAAIILRGIIRDILSKNYMRFVAVILTIIVLFGQLFLESIQLMVHLGSYVNYPVRNGFMIYLVLAYITSMYVSDSDKSASEPGKSPLGEKVVISGIGFVITFVVIYYYKNHPGMSEMRAFFMMFSVWAMAFVAHLFFGIYKKGKLSEISVAIFVMEALVFGVMLIGKPEFSYSFGNDKEQEGEYIDIANSLNEAFDISDVKYGDPRVYRVKNPDTSLNANYGMILGRATLSNWSGMSSSSAINTAINLGYTNQFTRVLDAGGTVFTDALLSETYTISRYELSPELYECIGNTEVTANQLTGDKAVYYFYRNRYTLPFGVAVDKDDILSTNIAGMYMDMVGVHNGLYRCIRGAKKNTDIAELLVRDVSFKGVLSISGRKALYMTGYRPDCEEGNLKVSINGKNILIPSINDYDNYGYPAHFNNGCVFLGCFDDEDVEIDIEKDSIEDVPDYWVDIFTVDLDIMDELCKNATGAGSVSVKGASLILDCDDDANAMLIPLTYDKGYKVVDDAANIYDYAALFTLLTEFGDEQVTIKYVPIGYMLGIIIGLLALVADIVVFGVKKLVIKANRLITVMYIGAMLSAVAVMYVIPVVVAIFKLYVFR